MVIAALGEGAAIRRKKAGICSTAASMVSPVSRSVSFFRPVVPTSLTFTGLSLKFSTMTVLLSYRKRLTFAGPLCILSKQEAYASSIIDSLKAANMIVVEGTLYPLLIRQKNQGLLTYRWEESTQGPPRKYYGITEKGRAQLAEMDAAWQEMVESIDALKK